MLHQNLKKAALLATISTVLAHPYPAPATGDTTLIPRQMTSVPDASWVNSKTGTITFVFSDDIIGYGTISPGSVATQLGSQCYDSGICNTTPWSVPYSMVPAGGAGLDDLDITVTTIGDYPSWAHNGLTAAFAAAVTAIQKSTTVTYDPNVCDTIGCEIQPNQELTQYTGPSFMAMVYQGADKDAPPSSISMTVSTIVEGGGGFCGTFNDGVGLAVAGAISPWAGIGWSLLGLACQ